MFTVEETFYAQSSKEARKLVPRFEQGHYPPSTVNEELNEDHIGHTILKSEVVKVIKDMRRKKATWDDNIPVDLLRELGDSGLKIITALVNKIYMSGD